MRNLLLALSIWITVPAAAIDISGPPSNISVSGRTIDDLRATTATVTGQTNLQGLVDLAGGSNAFVVGDSTFVAKNGRVGILTASPQTALDVNGAAQFGSGATKSTFSATGALTLASGAALTVNGSTFSVSAGGVVAAPSDPHIRLIRSTTQNTNSGVEVNAYFGTKSFGENIAFDVAGSSGVATVPYAGVYRVSCRVLFASNATGIRQVQVAVNGSNVSGSSVQFVPINGDSTAIATTDLLSLTAGQTVGCVLFQNSGGDLNASGAVLALEKVK